MKNPLTNFNPTDVSHMDIDTTTPFALIRLEITAKLQNVTHPELLACVALILSMRSLCAMSRRDCKVVASGQWYLDIV